MTSAIPPDATFRRPEGLTYAFRMCRGLHQAVVAAARQDGETEHTLSLDELRLLARMSRWSTAEELGVPRERLVSLVDRNLAFWSRGRPARDLTGDPLDPLEGAVAFRDNVDLVPLILASDGTFHPIPTMPRQGTLDQAEIAGAVLHVYEMDVPVATLAFVCCPRHATMIRELVVALDGARTVADLSRDPERKALLETLGALGLLERHAPPRWDGAAQVTWLTHAAVLYEAASKRLLVDPVFFPRSSPTRVRTKAVDVRDLGPLDAVLITHGDTDHFNVPALSRLPRETPIVLPSVREKRDYHVDMRRVLSMLGFERVIPVDEWQRLAFGDVTVVATPFRGEDWGLDLPCRTYLIHSPELTIFLNADSTSTPEAYDRIASEFAIDVAFLGVTGAAESHAMPPGFGYGDFYVKWIPREKHNEWVELSNGPRESAEAARRLRARYAVGYAAGGSEYYTLTYSDRGTHADLARLLTEAGGPTKPLDLEVGVPTRVPRPTD
jgi:L-ascorbate metabolism protein UlaG (beta-lactamase superfamily)